MKKIFMSVFIMYLLYAVIVSSYIFIANPPIDEAYIGTEADPAMFMDEECVALAKEYSKWRNVIYFINTPFEWLIYLFIICFGLSTLFSNWSSTVSRFRTFQTCLYVLLLATFSWFLTFPIAYFSYSLSKSYQISVQPFNSWMKDQCISFWIDSFLLIVIALTILYLIRKAPKKWWIYTWLLSIPFTLLLMFIQPVIIDPLYNDFYPIKNKQLEEEILALAEKADIPTDRVYEVEMSNKTNAMNAYVNGIGQNLRIVLWDTTLERLSTEEVLYIMAHEMGHYDLHHLPLLLLGTVASTLVGLYLAHIGYMFIIRDFGRALSMKIGDIATLPIILLLFSLLSFAANPVSNYISRSYEYMADEYAIDLTNNPDAAISTLHKLSTESLADVHPPTFIKLFRFTHPPMVERITHIRLYSEGKQQ